MCLVSPDPIPTPFLLLLWRNHSPQTAPLLYLHPSSHTTHAHSTGFSATPVGAMENCGCFSLLTHRFSKSPLLHSHDLENSHPLNPAPPCNFARIPTFPSQLRVLLAFLYLSLRLSTARYHPPCTSQINRSGARRSQPRRPSLLVTFYWLFPVIQRTAPVFHARFTFKIATIRLTKQDRFRPSASCCTVRA